MLTPIVKVTKGKSVKSFYNLSDYEKWKEKEGWSEQRHTGTTKTHVCHLENKLPTQVLSTRAPATDEIEQACSMAAVWQGGGGGGVEVCTRATTRGRE